MQLSTRLMAVAEMAAGAVRLADIGTDHGYVPIYLALYRNLEYAVAMDVNPGPLERAREHIRQYGLEEKIITRLSDGAAELLPGEADTVVLAGMGGQLMIRILTEGEARLQGVGTFVLQPQSEIESVRRFLHRQGYRIVQEDMVKDDGKFYPLMKARRQEAEPWEDVEYRYGRHLIRSRNRVLAEFLDREERILDEIGANLSDREGGRIRERLRQLEKDRELLQKAKLLVNA